MNRARALLASVAILAILITGCVTAEVAVEPSQAPQGDPRVYRVVMGTELKGVEPIIREYAQSKDYKLAITYKSAVDIANIISAKSVDEIPYDAVFTEDSMWLDLFSNRKNVKNVMSMMRSPIVYGVKKSVAEDLGWIGNKVTESQILTASARGDLTYIMASATQANTGAIKYLGALTAYNGGKMLDETAISNEALRENTKKMLSMVNRSSSSSGDLNSLMVANYEQFDAEVNYEALIIAANRGLVDGKKLAEPMYCIYPSDGLGVADFPLAMVDHKDQAKNKFYGELQQYLLSVEVQDKLKAQGWRTGLGGGIETPDPKVFNPEWGIQPDPPVGFLMPRTEVVKKALVMYQTVFRRKSYTVWCLDVSGSMGDPVGNTTGLDQLKNGMTLILDPDQAEQFMIQPTPNDVTVIIPFNSNPVDTWTLKGNDPNEMRRYRKRVNSLQSDAGTDIYAATLAAYEILAEVPNLEEYSVAVKLMTDGRSSPNTDRLLPEIQNFWQSRGKGPIPIIGITFGEADRSQLETLAQFSQGRVIEGREDLPGALKQTMGYN